MPRSHFRKMIDLAIAVAAVAITVGCERSSEKKAGHSAQQVMRVEVVRPERHTVQRTVGEPGQLEAFETTPIHAKIAGYVKNWTVNIGYEIKKGQVLAELWVPEVEADLGEKRAAVEQAQAKKAQAEAAVEVAQAAVVSAEARVTEVQAGIKRADADLMRWQREYGRVEQLFNERAQTGTLLDETRNKLHSAEAARDEVRAKVKSAEAALSEARSELDKARSDVVAAAGIDVARSEVRHAEAMLGYTRIEAPFDGIVTRRNVDTGDLTQPGAAAEPLFIVARTDPLTITVAVPEGYATEVKPGDDALVKLQAMKGRTVAGKVTRTAWALDPKTRTIRVEIDIPNPGGKLRPGLYAYSTVIVEEHKDVLTIPTTAIVPDRDQTFCVAVVDGKAVRRRIATGLSDGIQTEVTSGLQASEVVVKAGAASIVEGQTVEVVKPAAQPEAKAGAKSPEGAKP
jgi:multidrug efflux pump subunit AcrA (membrane-fusion protein)